MYILVDIDRNAWNGTFNYGHEHIAIVYYLLLINMW